MLFQFGSRKPPGVSDIAATVFRRDRRAELVTVTELSFNECQLRSRAAFEVAERLRLHLPGQGMMELEVRWVSGDLLGAVFVTECHV